VKMKTYNCLLSLMMRMIIFVGSVASKDRKQRIYTTPKWSNISLYNVVWFCM